MRIAFDVRSLQAGTPLWGMGTYTWNLISHLALVDGQNEYFLIRYDTHPFDVTWDFPSSFRHEWITVPSFGRVLNTLRDRQFLHRDLRRCSPDIVHFTTPLNLTTHFSMGASPQKSILTFYDLTPLLFGDNIFIRQRALLRPLYHMLLRDLPRQARYCAISQCTRRDMEKYLHIPADHISVIYLGVGPEFNEKRDREQEEMVRKRYHLPGRFILYVGNFFPYKNVPLLLEALTLLNRDMNNELVLAGTIHPFFRKGLEAERAARGLQDCVHFTGFVSAADLPVLYRMADVFVYPSLYEGFGFPPLEAMACGTPVVCSSASSLPEVVGEGALLFDPLSAAQCAHALETVLTDGQKRTSLIEKGLVQARRFTWANCAERTLNLYQSTDTN